VTAAPTQTPESQDSPPSTARLLSVLAIVFVACAGLVIAGVLVLSRSSDPGDGAAEPHAAPAAPHDLPAGTAPTIRLSATPDTAGGWNLRIVTDRFTWSPEHAGGAHVDGEGHAHVWVGDTKVGRAYGEWFYLPESLVPVGEQTVRVVLNGNDHGDYRAAGTPVDSSVTVVATSEAASDGHHHQH
jgi:hypothetical protein